MWMTVVSQQAWDGTDWWQLETDNGETIWLRIDSEVFLTATYE
jgi:hypothetical protein